MFKINDDYFIDFDPRQMILKKYLGEKIDKNTQIPYDDYAAIAYFGDYSVGFKKLRKLMLDEKRKESVKPLDEVIKAIAISDNLINDRSDELKKHLESLGMVSAQEHEKLKKKYEESLLAIEQLKNKKKGKDKDEV